MTKTTYCPSANELRESPKLFLYELMMFRFATDSLTDSSIDSNVLLKNVMIESALIHLRNLYEFFCGKESSKDNIIAGHFIEKKPDGTAWKSPALPFIASCKDRINKSLSHLTYTRVKGKTCWRFKRIRQDIEFAYSEFFSLLPISEHSKWQA